MRIVKNYRISLLILLSACSTKDSTTNTPVEPPIIATEFSINGSKILHNGVAQQYIGVNAFQVFGIGSTDMNNWNIDITREFIGNVKETPLTGFAIKDANGAYLHPLQNLVNANRANHKITILCAFGWDGVTQGTQSTLFTGKSPSETTWWNNYKIILQQWATQFKGQADVWIEVWNEPYRYDRADGYTDTLWETDMNELVSIIRNTGNTNIIIVPCAEQGQDESVLINKGVDFLKNKYNILFDVHAYEKWLLVSDANATTRLDALKQKKLPVFFGEIAPMNAGTLMNPAVLLNSLHAKNFSICAWVWKKDETDYDALLTTTGLPNDINNNNWGTTYKNIAQKTRNP
jgi:mannan endo-1,4-beta-mannosidase